LSKIPFNKIVSNRHIGKPKVAGVVSVFPVKLSVKSVKCFRWNWEKI